MKLPHNNPHNIPFRRITSKTGTHIKLLFTLFQKTFHINSNVWCSFMFVSPPHPPHPVTLVLCVFCNKASSYIAHTAKLNWKCINLKFSKGINQYALSVCVFTYLPAGVGRIAEGKFRQQSTFWRGVHSERHFDVSEFAGWHTATHYIRWH